MQTILYSAGYLRKQYAAASRQHAFRKSFYIFRISMDIKDETQSCPIYYKNEGRCLDHLGKVCLY